MQDKDINEPEQINGQILNAVGQQAVSGSSVFPEQPMPSPTVTTPIMPAPIPVPVAAEPVVLPSAEPALGAGANSYFSPTQSDGIISHNVPVVAPASVVNNQPIISGSSKPKANIGKIIKIILIALAAVAVLIGGYFAIKYFFLDNSKSAIENKALELKYAQDRPIAIKKGKLYGFIDTEGKTIIEPKYDAVVEDFHGNFAIVYNEDDSSDTSYFDYDDRNYFVISKSGEEKFQANYRGNIEYFEDYNAWIINSRLYDEKLNPITEENNSISYVDNGYVSFRNNTDDTFGVMDMKGNVKYTKKIPEGDSFISADLDDRDSSLKEVYGVLTLRDGKDAIVNFETGKVVYDYGQKNVIVEEDNIFKLYDNDKPDEDQKIYVANDKIVFETDKNAIIDLEFYSLKDQILRVEYNYSNKYKYYDIKNNQLQDTPPAGSSSSNYSPDIIELEFGYKEMSCNGKKGIVKGEEIILPCDYMEISFINSNVFKYIRNKTGKEIVATFNDGKYFAIDLKSKAVLKEFNEGYLNYSQSSVFLFNDTYRDNPITVYNMLNNKSSDFDKDSEMEYYTNYFTVEKDGKKAYYNGDFKKIYEEDIEK